MREIRVVELFAGVGGFRIGLEKSSLKYKIVWSNQWEPSTKTQHASDIYVKRFGEEGHSNQDIAKVSATDIPQYNMLTGGFPCQDYSVARILSQSNGIQGKKGVLWWEIHRIIKESKHRPEFLFLENVDRLLKSPASQRGRDFAMILASLSDLGYIVEWRVINPADYGMPQRRRRVFIMGYLKSSKIYKSIKNPTDWMLNKGVLTDAFKIDSDNLGKVSEFAIIGDLVGVSNSFNKGIKLSPFENCGLMIDRKVYTTKVLPNYKGSRTLLKDILLPENQVPKEFFIDEKSLKDWNYLKGAKKEQRFSKSKGVYFPYNEGSMVFPDPLDKPSRTIVTGEGGSSPSRFKHVIKTESGKLRRLTPIELERLNMFPDNHTEGVSDVKRAFLMGNALVVGVIEKIGESLAKRLDD